MPRIIRRGKTERPERWWAGKAITCPWCGCVFRLTEEDDLAERLFLANRVVIPTGTTTPPIQGDIYMAEVRPRCPWCRDEVSVMSDKRERDTTV